MDVARRARLLLMDDHPLFRKGLAAALASETDVEVVCTAADGPDVEEIARRIDLDLVTLDMLTPSGYGKSVVAALRAIQPGPKILSLSTALEPGLVAEMFAAGANGYALKSQPIAEVLDAIRAVLAGSQYLAPSISREAVDAEMTNGGPRLLERLTAREREVFELLIRGFSNEEVATQLSIARRTAETHRKRIAKKLDAHSIVRMQRVAVRYGALVS